MDLIVDGPSLFARNFYAALSNARGGLPFFPAQSITLAMRSLLGLLNPSTERIGYQFDRMLVAWDLKQNPQKNRDPKPAQYYEMRELFQDVLTTLFQCAHAAHPDYEADDLVATSVYKTPHEAVIVSGDKDLMQLQSERVHYYCLNQKALLSERFITNKWHVHQPSQIAIALAIIGDTTDNIGGIPGWGPKKAQKLFETVPRDADFEDALNRITAQIPENLQPAFWTSLDRTLLDREVPDVPEPAPITLADPDLVNSLDLGLEGYYDSVWNLYAGSEAQERD